MKKHFEGTVKFIKLLGISLLIALGLISIALFYSWLMISFVHNSGY
jgi:hypothetical protein